MSGRDLKRRVPVPRRLIRRPSSSHLSPSPSPSSRAGGRRGGSRHPVNLRLSKRSRPVEILKRSLSEPALFRVGGGGGGGDRDHHRNFTSATPEEEDDGVLYRPQTCADIFSPSSEYSFLPRSPRKSLEGYKKDAKVVVNVTVEGSPGPVRTMVKLGSSVEETIKLVIDRYSEEGRTPRLDKDGISTFELHHSYFSLQSLNKSEAIGDAGIRSFYLRRNCSYRSSNASLHSDNFSDKAGPDIPASQPLVFLQSFIVKKFYKVIRRTHKLWKILGCIHCNG